MRKYAILLTACVNPDGMPNTEIQDVAERMQQYYDALIFYCHAVSLPIVFVDNSGVDLSFLKNKTTHNVEFISFSGNNIKSKGKGYGEALIIEYALSHSSVLQNADVIIKITGRLKVSNLRLLVCFHRLLGNKDGVSCSFSSDLSFSDSRIFFCSRRFLISFLSKKELISDNEGSYFEHILSQTIKENPGQYSPFWIEPSIFGVSGSNGMAYTGHKTTVDYYWAYVRYQYYIQEKLKRSFLKSTNYTTNWFWVKHILHRTSKQYIYIFMENVAILCTLVNLVYMHHQIMHIDYILSYYKHHIAMLSPLFIDTFIVYLAAMLWPCSKGRIVLFGLSYFVSTIYIMINIGYSRYFDSYLPLNLYFEYSNLNGLKDNILYAFKLQDCLLLVTSLTVICALWICLKFYSFSLSLKRVAFIPLLLILLGSIPTYKTFVFVEKEYHRQKKIFSMESAGMDERSRLHFYADVINCQERLGLQYGLFLDVFFNFYHKHVIGRKAEEIGKYKTLLDSNSYCVAQGQQKNLIIILVESLSTFSLGKSFDNDEEITPVLNCLSREGVFFPAMNSQTQLGASSDGQFTYLTGLLPLKGTVTINELDADTIIALPRLFPDYKSYMVIPTAVDMWSQKAMCRKYGFSQLYSTADYRGYYDGWLTDKQLFDFADSIGGKYVNTQPFLSVILTSSMHSPYNRCVENAKQHTLPDSLSLEMKNYLFNTHYTDKCLGEYIDNLKNKGLYDNSIIVILADHKPNTMALNMEDENLCKDIPLIILNSPVDFNYDKSRHLNQTCVFPTILDMMNVDSPWRGVGKSLFMPDSVRDSKREQERSLMEQEISESIIYGKYCR